MIVILTADIINSRKLSSKKWIDDLKALLNKESPPIAQGYYVWDPIKKLHEQYPDWVNAKKINFKNFLIEAIRNCLTKFRK